ncbi:MAG: general secretion pathway protein GspE [Pirellulaceae bacterium]|jgi:hypothetical protein|nr:hypothetical protein [Thermoguttaceae bacterium]MDI9444384.1 general secretion pathway protein GspE [Planctomycetota bacterium]NLZ00882.1 general secretion pathway protein GspE [Pirellulaceae bacterium]
MEKQLDVYRDWLGITETVRPLNHYQLLRLEMFEDTADKIRAHYRKMNEHVRKYATGEFSEQSQSLLNQLAKAMLCLTDTQRKREYDASLGRKVEVEGRRRTFEEILLANKVVDQAQLEKARSFADAVGLDIHQAVMQQKLATPEVVMMTYAESIGLPYLDLSDLGVDAQLAQMIPPNLARQHSCVPVMADGQQLLMASPSPLIPDVEEELRLRMEMPVRTVLCTPAQINEAIAQFFPRDAPEMVPVKKAKKAKKAEPAKAAGPAGQKPAGEPLSAEEFAKRRLLGTIMGFNIGVVLAVGAQYLAAGVAPVSAVRVIAVGVAVGLVVGGITFGVLSKR